MRYSAVRHNQILPKDQNMKKYQHCINARERSTKNSYETVPKTLKDCLCLTAFMSVFRTAYYKHVLHMYIYISAYDFPFVLHINSNQT